MNTPAIHRGNGRKTTVAGLLAIGLMVSAQAAQELNGRKIFFGDNHVHTCLSHDADSASIEEQYRSLLNANGCDFGIHAEHAETNARGEFDYGYTSVCGGTSPWDIARIMKNYCNEWTGRRHTNSHGIINFVVFPGYEWAPEPEQILQGLDYRFSPPQPIYYGKSNVDDHIPGHINYFFDGTDWDYGPDVWEPYGARKTYAEILGQLIHQRDDPNRRYDLLIQVNHPASTRDLAGDDDVVTRWTDFTNRDCREWRLRYGVSGVEWYADQESAIGSVGRDNDETHHNYHQPNRYIVSRALKEGFKLAMWGGSDNHDGNAGRGALTAVYATGATRPEIWEGFKSKQTYALSRFLNDEKAVHKGRVDLTCSDSENGLELRMGQTGPATSGGSRRTFSITAAAEIGQTNFFPAGLRLYRVNKNTVLSSSTREPSPWLFERVDEPGKFGELLGRRTFTSFGERTASWDVWVNPGDAIFAVVSYSDDYPEWFNLLLDIRNPTIARTTPIWFEAVQEHASVEGEFATVAFTASNVGDWRAQGGSDAGRPGDDAVLHVGGSLEAQEWREYKFHLPANYSFCRLDFLTLPHGTTGSRSNLFAVRIDGKLLYSGRGGVDHPVNQLNQVAKYFPLVAGLHTAEVHMDDQEYTNSSDDFSCGKYDGPYGFVDALRFSNSGSSSVAHYVDGSSSCDNPVGRPECDQNAGPFKTVSQGRDGAGPWDLLRIRTGNYSEPLTFPKPLTIEAYGGPVVIGRAP